MRHVTAGGADYWESTTPKGVTRRYGTGPGSRITGPGGLTTRWLLAEVENPHGQKILYRYDGDPGDPDEDVPRNGFTYLSRILYGPGLTGPERELRFEYEARPDPVHDFRGGVERRISHRARAIEVRSHGLVHSRIRLGWDLGEIGETPTAGHYATARSRLSWVQRVGADGSTLPPVELRYTDSAGPELEWDQEAFDAPPLDFDTAWSWWPHAYLNPVDTGDLDGDGRVDLVMADQYGVGLQDVHLNTGSGFASFDPSWGAALAALGFAASRPGSPGAGSRTPPPTSSSGETSTSSISTATDGTTW